MSAESRPDDDVGVTSLELFFDLVFVFTITQLTRVVADDPTPRGAAKALLIFGNLWWMYDGYVWLTNAAPPRADRQRLLLLLGMAGFLVAALGIPDGAAEGGIVLGVGYLIVTMVHAGMLLGPMQGSFLRAMGNLGPANFITAVLVLLAGFTDGWVQWTFWTLGFVLHWVTPYLTKPGVMSLRAGHFVERHGLIVLIALGESVVAVGIGTEAVGVPAGLVTTAVLALVVCATLFWLYFDGDDEAAERVLKEAEGERRSWLCLHVYGYGFLLLLGGIILFAAGMRRAMAAYDAPASTASSVLIASGCAAYLVALAAIRWRLRTGSPLVRLCLAGLALLSALVGAHVSSGAQLAALAAVLIGGILVGRHQDRSPAAHPFSTQ